MLIVEVQYELQLSGQLNKSLHQVGHIGEKTLPENLLSFKSLFKL